MNILLAGATGAIGTPLVRLLTNRGHRVFAMTRKADRCGDLWEGGAMAVSLHVEAAAWAAVLALEKGARGAYNVADPGTQVSTQRIERELGWHESMRA